MDAARPELPRRASRPVSTVASPLGLWVCFESLADVAGQDTRTAAMRFVLTHNVAVSTPAVYDASRNNGGMPVLRVALSERA
jgi:hypothetical protein